MKPGFIKVFGPLVLVMLVTGLVNCEEDLEDSENLHGPVLVEPEHQAEFTTNPPVFIWEEVQDAEGYLLKIARDSIHSPIVILELNTTNRAYELSQQDFDQMPSGLYAWAAAAIAGGDTAWSLFRTFAISGHEVGSILISPDDGQVFTSYPPEFVWKAYDTQKGYLLRVAKGNFMTGEVLIQDSLADTFYTTSDSVFSAASNDTYVWSAAPIPDTGNLGWWEFRSLVIEKPLPDGPDLIYPAEDETITSTPLTFIWHSEPLADHYRLKVYGEDSPIPDTIVLDTTSDTAYRLPEDDFKVCFNGRYSWLVSSIASGGEEIWCDPQGFYIDKLVPALDLDTTYFPFGMDYEWVYEKKKVYGSGEPIWFDTVTIKVIDSTSVTNGWSFNLDGSFLDVNDEPNIVSNIIPVFGNNKIRIEPDPVSSENFIVGYNADTLSLKLLYYIDWYPQDWYEVIEKQVMRIKGLGVVYQNDLYYNGDHVCPYEWDQYIFNLLYFIKGEDTVWSAD